jgi:hypothetical protein
VRAAIGLMSALSHRTRAAPMGLAGVCRDGCRTRGGGATRT